MAHHIRKTLAAVAAIPLVVGLAACGSSSNASSTDAAGSGSGSTEVTVLDAQQSEPGNTQLQEMLDACAADNGLTINRQTVPPASLVQKVLQLASSKTMPDLLNIDNPDMAQFAAIGALTPLEDVGVDTSGYYEGMVGAGSFDDTVYGLPQSGNTLVLFYNKDLLDAAGLQAPTTWDELKTTAAALTSGDQFGFAMSAAPSYEGTWQFLPWMWSNGGDETDINTPETVEALQFVTDLINDGSMSPSVVNWGQGDAMNAFTSGKAAMVEGGIWTFSQLDESGINYGTVTFPVPNKGDTPITPLGGKVWTVPATGDKTREANAAKILECLNSDENQLASAAAGGAVPSKIEVAEEFAKSSDDPHNAISTEAVANARARATQVGADWPEVAKALYEAEQLAITGQQSPADALKASADSIK